MRPPEYLHFRYVQFKAGTNVDIVVESMKGFTLLDTPMGVCKAIIGGPIPDGMKALDNPTALLSTVSQGIVAPSVATVSPASKVLPENLPCL